MVFYERNEVLKENPAQSLGKPVRIFRNNPGPSAPPFTSYK